MTEINNRPIVVPPVRFYVYTRAYIYTRKRARVCVFCFGCMRVENPVEKHNVKSSVKNKYNNGNDGDYDVWSRRAN